MVNLSGSTIVGMASGLPTGKRQINVSGGSVLAAQVIAGQGIGAINISGGSIIASNVIAGQGIGAFGTIGVSDGSFQAESLTLGSGRNAAGSVIQIGGSVVLGGGYNELILDDMTDPTLTVGDGEEGTGEYTLAGGVLNLSGGELHISSTGSFKHSGGLLTQVGHIDNRGRYSLNSNFNVGGSLFWDEGVSNYTQHETGTLVLELAGNSGIEGHSQLIITNTAKLAGQLIVDLVAGFTPAQGDKFQIFDFSGPGAIGEWDLLTLPPLSSGLAWDSSDLYDSGTLSILSDLVVLKGDANNDNQVTGADLIIVQQNFSTIYPSDPSCDGLGLGDANDDCQVTGADLIIVQQNFGNTLSPVGAAVPEPASVCLLTLAGLGAMALRRISA